MTSPISTKIGAGMVFSYKPDDGTALCAIAHLAMVVAPSALSGISPKVNPRNVVMMSDFGAA